MFQNYIFLQFDFNLFWKEFKGNKLCELMNKVSILQNMPFLVALYN